MQQMPKIRNLGKTIDRFNQGCTFFERAVAAWREGNFQEYETALGKAATEAIGAMEWALKVYLRSVCRDRMTAEDISKLKQPNFNELMDLMKRYAAPPLGPDISSPLHDFKELRNAAEDDAIIPPFQELYDAIRETRDLILSYLPVEEGQLRKVNIPTSP
jgi:hypothetical protein